MNNTVPLKFGLTAIYLTAAQLAAEKRAQARKRKRTEQQQLDFDPPTPNPEGT